MFETLVVRHKLSLQCQSQVSGDVTLSWKLLIIVTNAYEAINSRTWLAALLKVHEYSGPENLVDVIKHFLWS